MDTGFNGTFVISWAQTELDGLTAAPLETLTVGAVWSWRGEAVRVDEPKGLCDTGRAGDDDADRRHAAQQVQRMVGAAVEQTTSMGVADPGHPLMDRSFVVSDGARCFTATLIEAGDTVRPLLMFHDGLPPRYEDLHIVQHRFDAWPGPSITPVAGGVICFTPGTRIRTPDGFRLVEELREGDLVQTRDSGAQEVQWVGKRRMSGARLFVMPDLRPIRFAAGAFEADRPDAELLVSPEHRMLLKGPAAQALFNTPEVLVPARQLINGSSVRVDMGAREVTYVHLLLPAHQIIWANGVEAESFHPASAALSALTEQDRARLLQQRPSLESNPHSYGDFARRPLSDSEAALLRHEVA
ncbi:Hint domain-containing protein [Ruegeria sp. 2205SS24-7]|uniref:Hint domain-containing protein n=1 Tax=Ruegeria discodermiae TaxID=3064389 RepID=UPI00274117A4|nr:Hint domain-containing protein [Ruegeria sp. 2205SS24-7]MDP5218109.1 Hint domain-containing protein [Ruegeria sp. 2205SS24-7]